MVRNGKQCRKERRKEGGGVQIFKLLLKALNLYTVLYTCLLVDMNLSLLSSFGKPVYIDHINVSF